jgi:hypothetical protein
LPVSHSQREEIAAGGMTECKARCREREKKLRE